MLEVVVDSAKGLRNADHGKDLTDAYVQVEVAGKKEKTKTVKNSLSPAWNETLSFTKSDSSDIVLKLYDDDMLRDDFLGQAVVAKNSLPFSGWLPLTDKKGQPAGLLHVSIKEVGQGQQHGGKKESTDRYNATDRMPRRGYDSYDPNDAEYDPYDDYDPYHKGSFEGYKARQQKYENMYRALATHRRTRDGYLTYAQRNPAYIPEYAPRRRQHVYDDYPSSYVYDDYVAPAYDYAPVRQPEFVDYPGYRVGGFDTYRESIARGAAYGTAPLTYGSSYAAPYGGVYSTARYGPAYY